MTEIAAEEPASRRRPFGLWMIIALETAIAIVLGLSLFGVEAIDRILGILYLNPLTYTWVGWFYLIGLVLAIVGMLRLKRWGWVLTMILTGAGLLVSISSYFLGNFNYVGLVVLILIAFYMNQRDVQSPFDRWNPLEVES